MKLPANLDKTLSSNHYGLFPPPGYISMEETEDGGGDNYGLYWEIGKETSYPIVCASYHEQWLLAAEFKDYESFNDWFTETQGQEAPGVSLDDDEFFISLTIKGKLLTKKGKHIEAVQKLESAVSLFGEYSEAWHWLSENYYATGQKEKGDRAIINSIASNFFCGSGVLRMNYSRLFRIESIADCLFLVYCNELDKLQSYLSFIHSVSICTRLPQDHHGTFHKTFTGG